MLLFSPLGSLQISAVPEMLPAAVGGDEKAEIVLLLSLVIPTYNEEENLRPLIHRLTELLDAVLPGRYELIVVDDNSPDQTWKYAEILATDYSQLRVVRRVQERGLSSAVVRGWQVARGEILGVMDADLQHPPDTLLDLLKAMDPEISLAVASRHVVGGGVSEWSIQRRILSRGAQILGLLLLPGVVGQVSDPMSGYFLVRREAIAGPILNPMGYKILVEVLARGHIKAIAEVGYVFQERLEGQSKVTWQQYIDYVLHLVRLRSQVKPKLLPLPISLFMRFCLVGLSGVFVDMTMLYLLSDPTTLGWGLTRSKILAAETAIVNNFLWNDAWTFNNLAAQQTSKHQRLKRFVKFNLICLIGLCLNVLILNFLFNLLHLNRYVANLVAIAIVTIWNFLMNWKLNWRVTDIQKSD